MRFLFPALFAFRLWTGTVEALGHFFDGLHHIFNHRLLLEKNNLAGRIAKIFFCHIESFVDEQEEMGAVGRSDFFYLSSEILRMPEAHQLNQYFALLILSINQREVWYHHRIAQEQHIAFTSELPVPALIAYLLLKFVGKICFKAAIEHASPFKVGTESAGVVEAIEHIDGSLRWSYLCQQSPALAKEQSRQKNGHLSAITEGGRDERGDGAVNGDAIAAVRLLLGPEHELAELDEVP